MSDEMLKRETIMMRRSSPPMKNNKMSTKTMPELVTQWKSSRFSTQSENYKLKDYQAVRLDSYKAINDNFG